MKQMDLLRESPYPGLRPFTRGEADLFFGREDQVEEMLAKLESRSFLAVVGVSGCGKSSLVQAGLIPALEAGLLSEAAPNWRFAIMRPGNDPFRRLASVLLDPSALGEERTGGELAGAFLESTLRRGPLGLLEAVQESYLPDGTNLLLVVDQFEEIFRFREQAAKANDADAFVQLLLAASEAGYVARTLEPGVRTYVILTMRSDFIGDCAIFAGLPEAINDSQFLTPRLSRSQYRDAIEEPARAFGGALDSVLTNRLLNDMKGVPDQLPVLQHALMRMWTRRQASDAALTRLTLADYEAVGGLAEALSRHADEALAELNTGQRWLAETLFRCLCERSADQRDTRRPARLGMIAAVAATEPEAFVPVVEAFRQPGRCFITPAVPEVLTEQTVLDISHESLIRQWKTLNQWVQDETESADHYRRLSDAARRWKEEKEAPWRDPGLTIVENWRSSVCPTAAWAERYGGEFTLAMEFLDISLTEREAERRKVEEDRHQELKREQDRAEAQRKSAERYRRLSRVCVVIAVVCVVIAGFAGFMWYRADFHERQAKVATELAVGEKQKAVSEAERADEQAKIASHRLGRFLAIEAETMVDTEPRPIRPQRGLLLAAEAYGLVRDGVPEVEIALRKVLARTAGTSMRVAPPVASMTVSRDGKMLAIGRQGEVLLWRDRSNPDVKTPLSMRSEGSLRALTFDGAGSHLIAVIRNVEAGKETYSRVSWSLQQPAEPPREVKIDMSRMSTASSSSPKILISPNGGQLAIAIADRIFLIDLSASNTSEDALTDEKPVQTSRSVGSLAFSLDGELLAAGYSSGEVVVWKPSQSLTPLEKLPKFEGEIEALGFAPDGATLAIAVEGDPGKGANFNRHLYQVKLKDKQGDGAKSEGGNPEELFPQPKTAVAALSFDPLGKALAIGEKSGGVRRYGLEEFAGEVRELLGHESGVIDLAFLGTEALISLDEQDELRLWRLQDTDAEPRVVGKGPEAVSGVAIGPTGSHLFGFFNDRDEMIRIWDLEALGATPKTRPRDQGEIKQAVLSPNGETLATIEGNSRQVRLQPLPGLVVGTQPRQFDKDVSALAFSTEGKMLATGTRGGLIHLWDLSVDAKEPKQKWQAHLRNVSALSFSPDGTSLASAGADKSLKRWRLSSPSPVLQLPEHSFPQSVSALAYHPKGRYIAVGTGSEILLIDPQKPVPQKRRLPNGEKAITALSFDPSEGRILASGDEVGTVKLWRMDPEELKSLTCKRVGRNISYEDWTSLWGTEEPYRKTCKQMDWPADFLDKGRKLVKDSGEIDEAIAFFQKSIKADDRQAAVAEMEARKLVAPVFVQRAKDMARKSQGKIEDAMKQFQMAKDLDSDIDPNGSSKAEIQRFAASHFVEKGRQEAMEGRIHAAISFFQQAKELDDNLGIEPEAEAKRLEQNAHIQKGDRLARVQKINEAINAITDARNAGADIDPEAWVSERLVEEGRGAAKRGNLDPAMQFFQQAFELNKRLDIGTLTKEARTDTAKWLQSSGDRMADQDKIDEALEAYRKAAELDKALNLDKLQARAYYRVGIYSARKDNMDRARDLLKRAKSLDLSLGFDPDAEVLKIEMQKRIQKMSPQDFEEVLAAVEKAVKQVPDLAITSWQWNDLCWSGSLWGYAKTVVEGACQRAVALEKGVEPAKQDLGVVDSRGLARALTWDLEGAKKDFEEFVNWADEYKKRSKDVINMRKEWIAKLKDKKSPFSEDDRVLDKLRRQPWRAWQVVP